MHLFALGKAAHAMTNAAVAELDGEKLVGGVCVAAEPHAPVHAAIASLVGRSPRPMS